jgi:hypothetical protein
MAWPYEEDENGAFRRNSFDLTFDLCSLDQTCSADPQRCSALAGLRHLAKQKAAESVRRLRATIAANQFNLSAAVSRTAGFLKRRTLECHPLHRCHPVRGSR